MNWNEWWEELRALASKRSPMTYVAVKWGEYLYRDYYEEGFTPEQAFEEEWG